MASTAVSAAGGPIGIGISVGLDVLKIGISQLFGHSVRLKDATNENTALTSAVTAFINDLKEITDALNAGSADIGEAVQFIKNAEQSIYTFLQKQVGKPGTSWTDHTGGSCTDSTCSAICNKGCTAGCCVFFTFFLPTSNKFIAILQAGKFSTTFNVPKTYSNKYGFPGSAAFTLTINPPKVSPVVALLGGKNSVPSSISSAVSSVERSVGFSGISSTNLLLGTAAVVTVIVGISSLRGSR